MRAQLVEAFAAGGLFGFVRLAPQVGQFHVEVEQFPEQVHPADAGVGGVREGRVAGRHFRPEAKPLRVVQRAIVCNELPLQRLKLQLHPRGRHDLDGGIVIGVGWSALLRDGQPGGGRSGRLCLGGGLVAGSLAAAGGGSRSFFLPLLLGANERVEVEVKLLHPVR